QRPRGFIFDYCGFVLAVVASAGRQGCASSLVFVLSLGLGDAFLCLAWSIDCSARNQPPFSLGVAEGKYPRDHSSRHLGRGRLVHSFRPRPFDHPADANSGATSAVALPVDGALGWLFPGVDHPTGAVEKPLLVSGRSSLGLLDGNSSSRSRN